VSEAGPWWAGGLRFSCTQCGNCCSGPPGAVWIDDAEATAIAAELGLPLEEFVEGHTRRVGPRRTLRERRSEFGHDCVFLDRSEPGKATCRIYRARPRQCRTWPFWPENLEDREAWETTRRRVPCPGMGEGTLHGPVEIRIALGDGNAAR